MFDLVEVEDRLARRRIGQKLLDNDRLFEDYMRPCPEACGYCQRCQISYETILHVLGHDNCVVFSVRDGEDECGVVYFTGSMMHAHFWDGQLFGKHPAIAEACDRMVLTGAGTIEAQVPENSEAIGHWLKKHGWETREIKEEGFEWYGNNLDVEVLEWAL